MIPDPTCKLIAPATYGQSVSRAFCVVVFVLGSLLLTGIGTVGSAEPHHVHTITVER